MHHNTSYQSTTPQSDYEKNVIESIQTHVINLHQPKIAITFWDNCWFFAFTSSFNALFQFQRQYAKNPPTLLSFWLTNLIINQFCDKYLREAKKLLSSVLHQTNILWEHANTKVSGLAFSSTKSGFVRMTLVSSRDSVKCGRSQTPRTCLSSSP